MSSKQMVLLQQEGIEACEQNDWLNAVAIFQQVPNPSSVIWYNIGCCHLQLQQYLKAENAFKQCIAKDRYLVAGYFQLAIAQTHVGNYAEAMDSFKSALSSLRGNPFIDYKQLQMQCKIYACDIQLNLALLYIFSGDIPQAYAILREVVSGPKDEERYKNVKAAIDALDSNNWVYFGESALERLVCLSNYCLFRPSKSKMEGLQSGTKFMNPATVVSATNDDYSFVGFVGPKKMQQQREKEELFPIKAGQSSHSVNPPPLPNVAPPRRTRSNPPPTLPPPVPSSTPPTKQKAPPGTLPPKPVKPDKKNILSKPVPVKPSNSKQLPSDDIKKASPSKRPSPVRPAKPSVNSLLKCSISISISLPKNKIGSYENFCSELSLKLNNISKAISSNQLSDYQITRTMQNSSTPQEINSLNWKDTYVNAVRGKQLDIHITQSLLNPSPKTEPIKSSLPKAPKPIFVPNPSVVPVGEDEDDVIYVDANSTEMNKYVEDDNNIYAEAVFSG